MDSGLADAIQKFINSPPSQLAAGGVLAGIVWKFFDRVDGVLKDDTKLEIAVWLVGRKPLGPKVQRWPATFANVFDRVFGSRHISWRCFGRSAVASSAVSILAGIYATLRSTGKWANLNAFFQALPVLLVLACFLNVVPDYISLLLTRYTLRLAEGRSSTKWTLSAIVGAALGTALLSGLGVYIMISAFCFFTRSRTSRWASKPFSSSNSTNASTWSMVEYAKSSTLKVTRFGGVSMFPFPPRWGEPSVNTAASLFAFARFPLQEA